MQFIKLVAGCLDILHLKGSIVTYLKAVLRNSLFLEAKYGNDSTIPFPGLNFY